MSGNSRSRVTITLGRSGQVVKRDGTAADGPTNLSPMTGSKRSTRERLGYNDDLSASISNKRQRGDGGFAVNPSTDARLRQDDLRYKIMQKNILKRSQNSQKSKMDLRSILSRPSPSSVDSVSTRQRMPDTSNSRMRSRLELQRAQSRAGETSVTVGGNLPPFTGTSNQQPVPGFKGQHVSDSGKQHSLKAKEGDRNPLDAEDVIRRAHKESYSRAMADIPAMRASSHSVSGLESGSAYSPWTLERIRQRSPVESLATSRGVSASQRGEELQRRYSVKTYDESRTASYVGKDMIEFSRPVSSSHMTKMAPPPARPMMSVGAMVVANPRETLAPRSSYMVDNQLTLTVDNFLRSLGLEKYAILLKAEEVDMFSLKRMGERDLKELGIPMGPRKKILLALQPNLKQQA